MPAIVFAGIAIALGCTLLNQKFNRSLEAEAISAVRPTMTYMPDPITAFVFATLSLFPYALMSAFGTLVFTALGLVGLIIALFGTLFLGINNHQPVLIYLSAFCFAFLISWIAAGCPLVLDTELSGDDVTKLD